MKMSLTSDAEVSDAFLDTRSLPLDEVKQRLAEMRMVVRKGIDPLGSAAAGMPPIG